MGGNFGGRASRDFIDNAFNSVEIMQLYIAVMLLINPFKVLVTPEYLYRPRQVLTRLSRCFQRRPERVEVVLPWGHAVHVRPTEVIGAQIYYYGVFDLLVSETVWRMLDVGDTAVDVGANLGQMTSLMSHRVGKSGRVVAWEPHPQLFKELEENMGGFGADTGVLELRNAALADEIGSMNLEVSSNWESNRGTAKLSANAPNGESTSFRVEVETLDAGLGLKSKVGVLKIDVEGFERQVLEGACSLVSRGLVRDIVFEDIQRGESGVAEWLIAKGLSVFGIELGITGPRLIHRNNSSGLAVRTAGDNFLATIDPERAASRMSERGWRVLSGKGR